MDNLISWFPGHMQKTTRLIKEVMKEIDLIIQIVDARAVKTSANDQFLKEIANNKPVLKIALKNDLAFSKEITLSGSILNKKFKEIVIGAIEKIMQTKIQAKMKKGYINPKIYVIVVGLPNVGKSSFINYMASNSQLIASDFPGVTRKKQWLNISDFIAMLDTPGIFYKKVKNFDSLAILTLIKTIKWEICPKWEIMEWAFNFYKVNYQKQFESFYKIKMKDFNTFLEEACEAKKMYLKKDLKDFDRAIEMLYVNFVSGKICKVNYDKIKN